jgi:hypothetical protein
MDGRVVIYACPEIQQRILANLNKAGNAIGHHHP